MEHRLLKLALGALALAALGFAGYRFMQRGDRVEITSTMWGGSVGMTKGEELSMRKEELSQLSQKQNNN
jgi:hypothetical protein